MVPLRSARTNRRAVWETTEVELCPHGQPNQVRGLIVAVWASLAEPGDRGEDQARIEGVQFLEGEPLARKVTGLKGLDNDIRLGRQPSEQASAFWMVQREGDPFLIEVVMPEIKAPLRVRNIPVKGTHPPSRVAFRWLDLYDLCPESRQEPSAIQPLAVGQIEYHEIVQSFDATLLRKRHHTLLY